jgi:hypothetical protein
MKRLIPLAAALLSAAPLLAWADAESCTLPGELVAEDAGGDAGLQAGVDGLPDGQDDILALYAAEPPALAGKLVFTVQLGGLNPVPPGYRWVVYFNAPGHETEGWWAAMTTTGDVAPRFVYGTSVVLPDASSPVPLRSFTEKGALDAASNFTADGRITLVLDKAAAGLPDSGVTLEGVLTTARRSAPDAAGGPGLTVDRAPESEGFYDLKGSGGCRAKSGVAALAGAFAPIPLLLLLIGALTRRKA